LKDTGGPNIIRVHRNSQKLSLPSFDSHSDSVVDDDSDDDGKPPSLPPANNNKNNESSESNENLIEQNTASNTVLNCAAEDCFGAVLSFVAVECKIGNRLFRIQLLSTDSDINNQTKFEEVFE